MKFTGKKPRKQKTKSRNSTQRNEENCHESSLDRINKINEIFEEIMLTENKIKGILHKGNEENCHEFLDRINKINEIFEGNHVNPVHHV